MAPGGGALWRCACDCGGETKVRSQTLRDGIVVSCGCYRADPAVRREARLKTDEDVRRESARRAGEASAVVRWGAKKKEAQGQVSALDLTPKPSTKPYGMARRAGRNPSPKWRTSWQGRSLRVCAADSWAVIVIALLTNRPPSLRQHVAERSSQATCLLAGGLSAYRLVAPCRAGRSEARCG